MTADPHSVKGWCPGALRPMRSGDGLVVRVRLSGGVLPVALARAVADLAVRFGNGAIDLSQRANLQIRGVTDQTLPPLLDALGAHGVLDRDAETEAVRNIIISPLSGLDPRARVDARHLGVLLEKRLTDDPLFRRLPGKFGWVIDDGGALSLDGVAVDVRFFGTPEGLAVEIDGGDGIAIRLGIIAPDQIGDAAARLAAVFLDLRGDGADALRRLRSLARRVGPEQIAAMAGFDPSGLMSRALRDDVSCLGITTMVAMAPIRFIGVGVPFGRLSATMLASLAAIAETAGSADLRLTPWRSVILPGVAAEHAQSAVQACRAAGLIIANDDPRLAMVACPGAPDCASGRHPIRDDALALATVASRLAGHGVRMHVSGCPKGCARPQATGVTLVAVEGGYDLVLDGRADAPPVSTKLAVTDIEGALITVGRLAVGDRPC